MKYYLMNKDKLVAELDSTENTGFEQYKINKQYERLPYGFETTTNWILKRQDGIYRQHMENMLNQYGCYKLNDFIKATHCTSINDTFWVKLADEYTCWNDISLYKNKFNDELAKVALQGLGDIESNWELDRENGIVTPEFSLGGSYSKCCLRGLDNELFIYKRGTDGFANEGLEPISEYLTSELYDKITHNSISYKLDTLCDTLVSRCKVFTNENIGLVAYENFDKTNDLNNCLKFYSKYDSESKFRAMLIADAICFNEDRHAGNHGVLVNNDTLEIIDMSRIYDNNITLLPYAMASDFDNIDNYMSEHNTRLGDDWVRVAREVLTDNIKETLINLRGYKFEFNSIERYVINTKFTKERLDILTKMVNQQIDNILGKGKIVGFTDIESWESTKKYRTQSLINKRHKNDLGYTDKIKEDEDFIRIEHIDRIRKAYIMFRDQAIGEIYHEFSGLSGEFDWVIKIYWDVWDRLVEEGYTMDIAGIDDTLRKKEYIRRYNPSFVTQRTIPEGRRDLRPLLREIYLRSNDLFEVMCRTHAACGNDDFYVSRTPDKVVDVNTFFNYDIPDFDTDCYGWLDKDGNPKPYGVATEETMNWPGDTLLQMLRNAEY